MHPPADKRRWRFWISNYWRRWLLFCTLALMLGHLLISQVSLSDFNRHNSKPKEPEAVQSPKQGDRKLNMVVTPWSSNRTWVRTDPSSKSANQATASAEKPPGDQRLQSVNNGHVPAQSSENAHASSDSREPNSESLLWIQQQESKYRQRNERIRQVCRQRHVVRANPPVIVNHNYSTIPHHPGIDEDPPMEEVNLEHFTMATSFRTMGCFVNKVASSSLVSAFLLVNGYKPSFDSPHSLAPFLRPRSIDDFLFANSTFFKFMFVRHPMERLLSCYVDKMVESPHWSLPAFRRHVQDTAKQIIQKRTAAKRLPVQPDPSLGREPSRIGRTLKAVPNANSVKQDQKTLKIDEMDKEKIAQFVNQISMDGSGRPKPSGQRNASVPNVQPTFEEFLEFILATDLQGRGYDSHWVPFWRYCSPCSVPYHVVGKLETAGDDFQYIWNKTGLDTKVPIPWVNKKKSKSKEDLERKYYSSISRELILRVYRRFRLDFELFDYSINEILSKAGYEPVIEDQWK